jgi:hypothetical protein
MVKLIILKNIYIYYYLKTIGILASMKGINDVTMI